MCDGRPPKVGATGSASPRFSGKSEITWMSSATFEAGPRLSGRAQSCWLRRQRRHAARRAPLPPLPGVESCFKLRPAMRTRIRFDENYLGRHSTLLLAGLDFHDSCVTHIRHPSASTLPQLNPEFQNSPIPNARFQTAISLRVSRRTRRAPNNPLSTRLAGAYHERQLPGGPIGSCVQKPDLAAALNCPTAGFIEVALPFRNAKALTDRPTHEQALDPF